MSEKEEIDPEALRQEVEQIKDAMGLQERYPSQFALWLVFGVLVLLASLGSQLIVYRDLPGYYHPLVWFGFVGVGAAYQWWSLQNDASNRARPTDTKPRIGLQFAAVFAMYVVVLFTFGSAIETTAEAESILLFSLPVALVGVAYLVTGESLRAYYIRRRDRWSFYLGGAWMLLLAVVMPNVEMLETWGYTVFGITYAVHALGSYLVLSR